MNALNKKADDGDVPLADSLRQTGQCIHEIGFAVLELEQHLLGKGSLLVSFSNATRGLQAIDFIKQASDDIAAMLDRLADGLPASAPAVSKEVFEDMKLKVLRDAIGCKSPGLAPQGIFYKDEGIELF